MPGRSFIYLWGWQVWQAGSRRGSLEHGTWSGLGLGAGYQLWELYCSPKSIVSQHHACSVLSPQVPQTSLVCTPRAPDIPCRHSPCPISSCTLLPPAPPMCPSDPGPCRCRSFASLSPSQGWLLPPRCLASSADLNPKSAPPTLDMSHRIPPAVSKANSCNNSRYPTQQQHHPSHSLVMC